MKEGTMKKRPNLIGFVCDAVRWALSQKKKERERGMTLIEIMIVIMIILLLAGTVSIVAISVFSQSQRAAAKNQIKEFETALGMYLLKCHTYPTQDQGLSALVKKPTSEPIPEGWTSSFLNKLEIPKDLGKRVRIHGARPGRSALRHPLVRIGRQGRRRG
jgi:type II secretion system protein G